MAQIITGHCVYNSKPVTCLGECATDCPFFNGELDTPIWRRKLHGGNLANLQLVGVSDPQDGVLLREVQRKALEREV